MRGAWLKSGAVGTVLLFGSPSLCLANSTYDRQLESAIMKIVAAKVGDIRGSLDREWTPPAVSPSPSVQSTTETEKPSEPRSHGSFVTMDPPAIAIYVTTAATSLVTAAQAALEPILGSPPERKVRVISLYH